MALTENRCNVDNGFFHKSPVYTRDRIRNEVEIESVSNLKYAIRARFTLVVINFIAGRLLVQWKQRLILNSIEVQQKKFDSSSSKPYRFNKNMLAMTPKNATMTD